MSSPEYSLSIKIPGVNGRFTSTPVSLASDAFQAYKTLIQSHQCEDIRIKVINGSGDRTISPEKLELIARREGWKGFFQ